MGFSELLSTLPLLTLSVSLFIKMTITDSESQHQCLLTCSTLGASLNVGLPPRVHLDLAAGHIIATRTQTSLMTLMSLLNCSGLIKSWLLFWPVSGFTKVKMVPLQKEETTY